MAKRSWGSAERREVHQHGLLIFLNFMCLDYLSKVICFFVPKFHLPAHIAKCQTIFSFNFMHFVGQMDGEAPEMGWLNINPMASSTKAMGPGCHHDTLDDHFGDWNWKKIIGLGTSLLYKMKDALAERAAHALTFEEFNAIITLKHHSAKAMAITQAGVRLKLVELEAKELQRGIDSSLHPEILPSMLIASGIDLEEEQSFTSQPFKALLIRQLHVKATRMLNVYTCGYLYGWEPSHAIHAYETTNGNCAMRRPMMHWKNFSSSVWMALKNLATIMKKNGWQGRLQELADNHIKPLVDPYATGEGRCHVLWIWMMDGVDHGNDGDDNGVRTEWCKSCVRALRWSEEVELLREEMRRVLEFFTWQQAWWEEQGKACIGECAADIKDHFHVLWALFLSLEDPIDLPPQLAKHSLPDLMIPNIP
ncbi:hypothetical protein BD769DRAFT_1383033 [Suillus cothurnatus]|nr:hypothetical protein BD769DRAFT_1383033 [Suillus cothurnatus]